MPNEVNWRDYVDARLAAVDRIEQQLQHMIQDVERRTVERIEERDKTTGHAHHLLEERMTRMSQFRDQITGERGLYVTRDQLELTAKNIVTELDIVKRSMQISSGRDVGVGKVWSAVLIAFSIMAAMAAVVAAAGQYFRH